MAAYTTLEAVRGICGQIVLNSTSRPTETQAAKIVDDIASEIDVRLAGAGFLTPVTTPAAFLVWVGNLNQYGAAAGILKSKFPDAVGPGDTPAYAFWEARYRDGLELIASGGLGVPDAPTGSGYVGPSTYFTRNPDEHEELGEIAEPKFKMDTTY